MFVRKLSRQKALKNSARYLKANINFMYCTINVTIQRFLGDEKILCSIENKDPQNEDPHKNEVPRKNPVDA